MVSISLGVLWIKGTLRRPVRPRRFDTRVQLLALAILIVILLPVISMTDDMRAMSTAEIERVTRRADLLPNADQPQEFVDSALDARLFPNGRLLDLHVFARVELLIENLLPQCRTTRQMANRPPPVAA